MGKIKDILPEDYEADPRGDEFSDEAHQARIAFDIYKGIKSYAEALIEDEDGSEEEFLSRLAFVGKEIYREVKSNQSYKASLDDLPF